MCVSGMQANGQAAFFVALFRKETRDVIMHWVQRALPTSIPGLRLQQTPAQFLHSFVDNRIQSFQDGVDRRAAARGLDPRQVCHTLCRLALNLVCIQHLPICEIVAQACAKTTCVLQMRVTMLSSCWCIVHNLSCQPKCCVVATDGDQFWLTQSLIVRLSSMAYKPLLELHFADV